MEKEQVKKEIKRLLRSMDYVSNFLNNEKISEKDLQIFFRIYQQLGFAWEFLGLQCSHWEGYKKAKNNNEVCKIQATIIGDSDAPTETCLVAEKIGLVLAKHGIISPF